MSKTDPESIVIRFNTCINNRDLDGLGALMADDHVFIDAENNVQEGKERVMQSWDAFFNQFPDYRNIFTEIIPGEDAVYVTGSSICSFEALKGPAIWTAKVKEGLVQEWRVYSDSPENRKKLKLPG